MFHKCPKCYQMCASVRFTTMDFFFFFASVVYCHKLLFLIYSNEKLDKYFYWITPLLFLFCCCFLGRVSSLYDDMLLSGIFVLSGELYCFNHCYWETMLTPHASECFRMCRTLYVSCWLNSPITEMRLIYVVEAY